MVLIYVFATIVAVNCCYFILFSRFSFLKSSRIEKRGHLPVSVIVCAKNEAENLKINIPKILNQDHENFEVILINDASIDESLDLMEAFAKSDNRVKVVNVVNNEYFWANKKYALTLGIKRAKNDHLVFIDADCYPASESWLSHLTSKFSEKKQVVLGYGAYEKQKGFLNKLIRFETLMTALQYFSYAKAGMPYMGVGRNLAYTSNLYYKNRGFISHIKIASGDDDLFVNEVANEENTAICFSEDSFTYSYPEQTFHQWKLQKKRHITTAKHYKQRDKMVLGTYFIFKLLFWISIIPAFIFADWKFILPLLLFRFLLQYISVSKAAKKLKENDLIYLIPFYELFLICFQLSIFISSNGSKQKTWK